MAVQCSQALAWTLLAGCLAAAAEAIHDTGPIGSQAAGIQAGGMGAGSGNDVCSGDGLESCSPPIDENCRRNPNAPGCNEDVCSSSALPGGSCGVDGACCSNGECCSGEGKCMETLEQCGPMCQAAYSAIDSPCFDSFAPVKTCDGGMQYKPGTPCGLPSNKCCGNALSCAQNFTCIVKPGPGNCFPAYGAKCPVYDGVFCNGPPAPPGGKCGPSNLKCCTDKHCCSKDGICVRSKKPDCDFCYPEQSGKDSLCWVPPSGFKDGLTGDGSECGQDTGFCHAPENDLLLS